MKNRGTIGALGFAIATVLFGCLLLVLNGGVVAAIYFAVADNGPQWMRNRSISQFALFLGPVILLVLEWTVIDLVGRHRSNFNEHHHDDSDVHREKAARH